MLRKNSANIKPEVSGQNAQGKPNSNSLSINIQWELNQLKHIIFDTLKILFVGYIVIDE
ncbi:MAG: hypothetical protein AB4080_16505 [Trichodesmium sp.]